MISVSGWTRFKRTCHMSRARKIIDRFLESLLIGLMGAMVVNVVWQVLTRFLLRNPSSYTEELARYLLIWLGLLGAGYCVGRQAHLAIDLVTSKLEGSAKHGCKLFGYSAILGFSLLVLVVGGTRLVYTTLAYQQTSAALQIPLGWVYLALPLSGALITFYCIGSILFEAQMLRRCILERT
jgi:TRAP-type C4-dicarboxylate transport system permease small subunit